MGLSPVAVYSECDRAALHVRYADEAYSIGPSAPRDSYLRMEGLIDVARRAGADALHPGYGFLAENEHFAAAAKCSFSARKPYPGCRASAPARRATSMRPSMRR